MRDGDCSAEELHYSKAIVPEQKDSYNDLLNKAESIHARLERNGEYSFLGKLFNGINRVTKRPRQKVTGRTVRNNTGVRIAIAGETSDKPGTSSSAWLYPGHNSNSLFEDVDAVVIAPGQKIFKSKADMRAKRTNAIVTSGAIKVPDNVTVAEVAQAHGMPGVFYVNSSLTKYYSDGHKWMIP